MQRNIAHDALAMVDYGAGGAALLLADGEAGIERARRAAEQAGYRITAVDRIEAGVARLDQQVAVDLVMIEAERDHGEELDRLLQRADCDARAGRYGCVVTAPRTLIDAVHARTGAERLFHLCEPDEGQLLDAVRDAGERNPARLQDAGRSSSKLQQLSEEVGRIATVLAALSEDEAAAPSPARREGNGAGEIDVTRVRAMIRARRLRDQYFRSELFADPAWDMLLDLMAARLEGQRVAVSSLCIAAAVPATTALRWIKTLTEHGLFVRVADPQDGRRVYIELSDKAAGALESYLRAVQRLSPLAV